MAPSIMHADAQPQSETVIRSAKRCLKVGLLLDSFDAPCWVAEMIASLAQCEFTEPVIIFCARRRSSMHQRVPAQMRALLFNIWSWVDYRMFREQSDSFRIENIRPAVKQLAVLQLGPPTSDSDLSAANLDVIVDLGSGAGAQNLSRYAKYGTWMFTGGNGAPQRRDYSLFWRLYEGRADSGMELLAKRYGRKDRVRLYASSFTTDLCSLYRMENRECSRRPHLLLQRLAGLYHHGAEYLDAISSPISTADLPDRAPSNWEMLRFLVRWSATGLRNSLLHMLFKEQWFLALRRHDGLEIGPGTPPFETMRPPRGFNYADPFLFEKDGRTYLFFENWSVNGGGVISCVELDHNGKHGTPEVVLKRPHHLSFPHVFSENGEIYMVPETRKTRNVELYRAVEFPKRWELAEVLLKEVGVADPTMLRHAGKFWLFASGMGPRGNANGELFLFFADSLFGPWQHHPLNPILCDVGSARCAGKLFLHEGQLLRPSQDCSTGYGRAVWLNRVDVISETAYRETPIWKLSADWMKGNLGTHTFNAANGWQVVDGRQLVWRGFPWRRSNSKYPEPLVSTSRPLKPESPQVL